MEHDVAQLDRMATVVAICKNCDLSKAIMQIDTGKIVDVGDFGIAHERRLSNNFFIGIDDDMIPFTLFVLNLVAEKHGCVVRNEFGRDFRVLKRTDALKVIVRKTNEDVYLVPVSMDEVGSSTLLEYIENECCPLYDEGDDRWDVLSTEIVSMEVIDDND